MSEMNTDTSTEQNTPAKKPGFFGRLFARLDNSLKQKAEEKGGSCCCSSDEDGKSKGKKDSCC